MTNAIEQTRRAYAQAMHDMTHHANGCGPSTLERLRALEDATEEHLEELRKDKGIVQAHLNDKCDQLSKMTEERDAIQLRLHSVDHAYREQQRKACTSGKVCADRGASEQPSANMAVVMAAVRGAQDIMVEYLVPDGIRAKRAMTKLIPMLDNEKLYSALYEIEHAEGKL